MRILTLCSTIPELSVRNVIIGTSEIRIFEICFAGNSQPENSLFLPKLGQISLSLLVLFIHHYICLKLFSLQQQQVYLSVEQADNLFIAC